ncbi:MAG TPA: DNA polymerase Y family protein [Caulobacteraceae bacterium]|nr:DNA polymerase Y family protein [Caulobacteraceae bacterium]
MARLLSVWSPNWPITAWRRRQATAPNTTTTSANSAAPAESLFAANLFALVETVKNARRLSAVSDAASKAGLYPFQTVADALALEPDLVTEDADPVADLAALEALADWCVRFSPAVAVDAPDGLILDIEGGEGLWGGEQAMLDDLVLRFARAGIPACAAVADTIGCAWALARFGAGRSVVPSGAQRQWLQPLPIESLRLDDSDAETLVTLGVTTVGGLLNLPRAELTRRFGPGVRLRLDQALGDAEEALTYRRAPAPFFERLAFFEPISAPEDLARVTADVCVAMSRRLGGALSGAQRFELGFHRVDGRVEIARVGTAVASRDAKRIAKLFAPKLETIDPGFGVEAVTLSADHVERIADPQGAFAVADDGQAFDGNTFERGGEDGVEALVDRLMNRLGEAGVWRPAPRETWVPERAVARVAPLTIPQTAWPADRPRPVRLFHRPEPIEALAEVPDNPPVSFRWRGQTHRVRRAEGPERLAQEWWRCDDVGVDKVRDYYRVEDAEGRRFWIFRAGLYAEDKTPRWWLHGLFA